ncbi:spore germination protein [Priestia abyssalis]|uniref:spore germination protein n=1 Tax=Priestia abyssalis TaxID=1221450 RepID=UPI000995D0D3|nr:spore germination protein [Priestia abyssalis]
MFRKKSYKNRKKGPFINPTDSHLSEGQLNIDLQENLHILKHELGNTADLIIRKFIIGRPRKVEVAAIYMEGLADDELVNEFITHSHSLIAESSEFVEIENNHISYIQNTFDLTKEMALTTGSTKVTSHWGEVISSLLDGNTIILFDGYHDALNISTTGSDYRAISEPTTQTVVRGSKEGFIESISSNTVMVRRRIKNGKLRVEKMKMGDISNTDVAIMYIEGIAKDQTLTKVKRRLEKIDTNAILESNHIEELIEEKTLTPFPTVFTTERPDQLSRNLLEGKVAIFVEGTPFALLVPSAFSEFFKTSEDYTLRYGISSLIRILRYIAFHFSIFSSPIYIALITYHQEIVPTNFLISLIAQREGVPYPAIIEALLLEFTFEILREAGIRIPRAIGPTISIAGALVIGEAAVSAGLVSPTMTIVVALTAISNFAIPSYSMANATRILRFIFMILASFSGLYGIALGYLIMAAHLCSLQSFGVHYLSPFAPFYLAGHKDAVLRFPFSLLDQDSKENR